MADVSRSVGRSVGRKVGRSVGRKVGRSEGRMRRHANGSEYIQNPMVNPAPSCLSFV